MLTALTPAQSIMVTESLSSGSLRKDGEAAIADFCEAAGNRDALRLRAVAAVDGDLAVPQRRHVRRVASHDPRFAFRAGDDDHVDVVGHDLPVRRDEFEMQIGHYFLPSIA